MYDVYDFNENEEALSFASYTRKFTDPPSRFARQRIHDKFYAKNDPTGLLPLDMPIAEFVRLAMAVCQHCQRNRMSHVTDLKCDCLPL